MRHTFALVAALATAALAGCFRVEVPDGELRCAASHACPQGMFCDQASGTCWHDGDSPTFDLAGADFSPVENDASMPGSLGHTCTGDGDCTSSGGNCVDGVCCNVPVGQCGTCQACNLPGHLGFCTPMNSGVADPRGGCMADPANCAAGGCNGAGACLPANGSDCASSCADGIDDHGQWDQAIVGTSKCDGTSATAAACKPVSTGSCANPGAICADATNCTTTCAKDADCAHGYYCGAVAANKVCVPRIANGGTCSGDNQCASYICASGTCAQCDVNDDDLECPPDAPICVGGVCTATCTPISAVWSGDMCTNGVYNCSADSECRQGSAPNCNVSEGSCACGIAEGATPCPVGQVCVASKCLVETAFPCVANGDCASGSCTASGLCGTMASGASCESWDEDAHHDFFEDCGPGDICCVSGVCTLVASGCSD